MKTAIKEKQGAWDEGRRASGLNRWDYEEKFGPRPVNPANEKRKEKKGKARVATQSRAPQEPQAEIAQHLTWAAQRAHQINADPASRRQCWHLAGLLVEQGYDASSIGYGPAHTNAVLTKRAASARIDELNR